MNAFSLENKCILITGASSGIGKQSAIECSKMGAKLVLLGRDEAKLKATLSELEGENHTYYSADLNNLDSIESWVSTIVAENGKIAGFIHSAGMELTLPFKNSKPNKFQELFNINVFAGFEFARCISLKKNCDEKVSFVFLSSIKGVIGDTANTVYSATKGALISGVRALAIELASRHIRVNCISPAMIETPLSQSLFENITEEAKQHILAKHPMGMGEPKDVALAAVYLLSDAAKWVTGTNMMVDGGYTAQ